MGRGGPRRGAARLPPVLRPAQAADEIHYATTTTTTTMTIIILIILLLYYLISLVTREAQQIDRVLKIFGDAYYRKHVELRIVVRIVLGILVIVVVVIVSATNISNNISDHSNSSNNNSTRSLYFCTIIFLHCSITVCYIIL